MTAPSTAPWASPQPVLLADQARAAHAYLSCALCPHGIRPGERIAEVPGRGPAHVACIAREGQ